MILCLPPLLPLTDGGKPHVVKDLHHQLPDALLVVDAADHLDADLWNALIVGELQADVLQDFDDALAHAHPCILQHKRGSLVEKRREATSV